jgi:hypothetical protein
MALRALSIYTARMSLTDILKARKMVKSKETIQKWQAQK